MRTQALVFAVLVLSICGWAGAEEPARVKVKIALVGDSTVTENEGWGSGFRQRIAAPAECVNIAKGGRSSKSYRAEGHWKTALDAKPDYVLIQFGHNDQPGKGPERETDPQTTFAENMGRYVDEARAAGIKPILVTSMTRRQFSGGKIKDDILQEYSAATAKVAKEKNVPLIDLHAKSIEALDAMGAAIAEALNPEPTAATKKDADGKPKPDRTHLSPKGSAIMANLVIEELKKVVPELATAFK